MSDIDRKMLLHRIDEALNDVRPHLAVDGGNVEVVDLTDEKIAKIKWLGTCEGCSMSVMTLKAGVEQAIMSRVPEVTGVEPINGVR